MHRYCPLIDFTKELIAVDYETFPIGEDPDHPTHPKPVVLSICDYANNTLIHRQDDRYLPVAEYLLQPGHILIGQNVAYDLGVLYFDQPDMITAIFDKFEAGEIYDTMLAEKLLNLTNVGIIKEGFVRGKPIDFRYDLGTLARSYLGVDMSEDKLKATEEQMEASLTWSKVAEKRKLSPAELFKWDSCGAWRTRYKHLANIPVEEWPERASNYALKDSYYTLEVAKRQIAIDKARSGQSLVTLSFQCMKAFMFALRTSVGVETDQEKVKKIEIWVEEELKEEKLVPLRESGIYIPAIPPKPKQRCRSRKAGHVHTGSCYYEDQFVKAVNAKSSPRKLAAYIIELIESKKINKVDLIITDSGIKDLEFYAKYKATTDTKDLVELLKSGRDKDRKYKDVIRQQYQPYCGYLALDKNFMANLDEKDLNDPILDNYRHYKEHIGIKNNSVPVMKNPILYPNYDCLKKTGRSSSHANKKGSNMYPSCNIQQINAIIRQAYRSREGYYMLSTDYGAMELVCAAQTCLNLLGKSVLSEILLKGYDAHAYLGAQIAVRKDPDFRGWLKLNPASNNPEAIYKEFMTTKGSDFWSKYRTLAKPVGLGLWGGLGNKTFMVTAKTIYGVIIESEEEAEELRKIWFYVFPEANKYFQYIRKAYRDDEMSFNRIIDGKTKKWQKYWYKSPYGMIRRNCDYTKIANGLSLQTPGGEGAMTAAYMITRECFDPSLKSVLLNNYKPYGFIHDEELGDVKIGKEYEVAIRIEELMKLGFLEVCPDIPVTAEPALMKNWSKKAESVMDHKNKTISLWEPKNENKDENK